VSDETVEKARLPESSISLAIEMVSGEDVGSPGQSGTEDPNAGGEVAVERACGTPGGRVPDGPECGSSDKIDQTETLPSGGVV